MTLPTIFVAIASYKDPLLTHTVVHALQQARHPGRVQFGIVDQCEPAMQWGQFSSPALARQIQYIPMDALQTRGTCFARAITQTLYRGETIYLQIDAHMHFPAEWDIWVCETLFERMAITPRCVVSSYPPSMVQGADGWEIQRHPQNTVVTHRVKESSAFDGRGIYLDFEAWLHHGRTTPIRGHHIAAGLLIAPGTFVEQFPYDPFLYYLGEEQMLALRVFTHGWEIWHPVDAPIGHRYNDHQNPEIRPVHWSDDPQGLRPISHQVWEHQSYTRQRKLVAIPGFGGVYGLGTERSVSDYAAHTGIDYVRRVIQHDLARQMPPEER